MANSKSIKTRLAIVVVALLLGGCAFGDRTAELVYPPAAPKGVAQAAGPSPSSVLRTDQLDVVVGEFQDPRPEKRKIGFVQNTYGITTANVLAANDVAEWIRGALVTELNANGYRASLGKSEDATAKALVVTGEIEKVLTKAYFTYNSEIIFSAKIERAETSLSNRKYVGRGGGDLNLASTAKSFGQSLALALQDALRHLVADIRQIK